MVPVHAVVLQKKNSEFKKLNENRSASDLPILSSGRDHIFTLEYKQIFSEGEKETPLSLLKIILTSFLLNFFKIIVYIKYYIRLRCKTVIGYLYNL